MSSSPLASRPDNLESVVAEPDRPRAKRAALTESDRRALANWNETTASFPHERCIHELFEEQVARTPDAPALVFGARCLTYAELNRQASALARRLRALGVDHETLVALFMERSLEQIVSLLAILKAGGAYVPLDPAYPRERLALMLADTAAPVLLAQRRLLDRVPACEATIICVDDEPPVEEPGDDVLPTVATPESLAYVPKFRPK